MHLEIIQAKDRQESVSNETVRKLYQLAFEDDTHESQLDSTSIIRGSIKVNAAYKNEIEYLTQNHINPTIDLTIFADSIYIYFADNIVEQTLVNAGYGDGVGITEVDAANITFGNLFKGNTTITSFDEFDKFIKLNRSGFSFLDCVNLKSINLSNCENLYENCFKETALTSVDNLGTVTNIPRLAFYNCSNLTKVVLPSTCKTIYRESFYCPKLSFTASDLINIEVFTGNRDSGPFGSRSTSLATVAYGEELYLPNVKTIGDNVFSNQGFTSINLPALTSLSAQGTFAGNTKLTEVKSLGLVSTLEGDFWYHSIGMFQNCTNLRKVTIPSTLLLTGPNMFSGCTSLSEINDSYIENVVQICGHDCFLLCNSLTFKVLNFKSLLYAGVDSSRNLSSMTLSAHNKHCTDVFYNTSYCNIYMPKFIKPINPLVYAYNYTIRSLFSRSTANMLYFRDVAEVYNGMFDKAYIKILVINNTTVPLSVAYEFENSKYVTTYDDNGDLFHNINSIGTIYVPDSAVDDYKNASNFSSQADKIKPLSECPRITREQAEAGELGIIEECM